MIDKTQIDKVITLIEEAMTITDHFDGEYIHHYNSPQELKEDLRISINNLREDKFNELNGIHNWFHPDSEWYDHTGSKGKSIGLEIFSITSSLLSEFKSKGLKDLIADYVQTSDQVVRLLKEKFNVPDLLVGWHQGIYEQTGKLPELGIKFYAFHGCGLAAHFRNKSVDFDFMYENQEPRHGGFELWKLYGFAHGQPFLYNKYQDKKVLENEFNELIESKFIYKPKQDNSPSLYCLSDNSDLHQSN